MSEARQKQSASRDASFSPNTVLRPRAQIEAQLSNAITSGILPADERLPSEAVLAEKFGVSRNTVREALCALEMKGLISKKPGAGGGSFVRSITEEFLGEELRGLLDRLMSMGRVKYDELADIRRYLEVPAVRLAAKNRSEEQLAEMWSIARWDFSESKKAANRPNLHGKIAEASGNPLLAAFISALHQQSRELLFLPLTPEVSKAGLEHHIDLVTAIERRDPDAAEAVLLKHLHYMQARVPRPTTTSQEPSGLVSAD